MPKFDFRVVKAGGVTAEGEPRFVAVTGLLQLLLGGRVSCPPTWKEWGLPRVPSSLQLRGVLRSQLWLPHCSQQRGSGHSRWGAAAITSSWEVTEGLERDRAGSAYPRELFLHAISSLPQSDNEREMSKIRI